VRKLFLLIPAVLLFGILFPQSVIEDYYSLIRQAEKCIVNEDFNCADQHYSAAMEINQRPFFIDVFNAIKCNLRSEPDTIYIKQLSKIFNYQSSNKKDLIAFLDFATESSDFNYNKVLNSTIIEKLRNKNFETSELSQQFQNEVKQLKKELQKLGPDWFYHEENQLMIKLFFNRLEKILMNPNFHEFELGFDSTQRLKEILDIMSQSKLIFEQRIQKLIMELIISGKLNNRSFVFYIDDFYQVYDRENTFMQRPIIKMRDIKYYKNIPPDILSVVDKNRKRISLNTFEELIQQYRYSELNKEDFFLIEVAESNNSHDEAYDYLLEALNQGKYLRLNN